MARNGAKIAAITRVYDYLPGKNVDAVDLTTDRWDNADQPESWTPHGR